MALLVVRKEHVTQCNSVSHLWKQNFVCDTHSITNTIQQHPLFPEAVPNTMSNWTLPTRFAGTVSLVVPVEIVDSECCGGCVQSNGKHPFSKNTPCWIFFKCQFSKLWAPQIKLHSTQLYWGGGRNVCSWNLKTFGAQNWNDLCGYSKYHQRQVRKWFLSFE